MKQAGDKKEYFYQTFLRIPMQLNMVCSLFEVDDSSLSSSRTELLNRIVQRCISREAIRIIRVKGCKVIREVKALLLSATKLRRLCFYRCVSIHGAGWVPGPGGGNSALGGLVHGVPGSRGVWGVPGPGGSAPWGSGPVGCLGVYSWGVSAPGRGVCSQGGWCQSMH